MRHIFNKNIFRLSLILLSSVIIISTATAVSIKPAWYYDTGHPVTKVVISSDGDVVVAGTPYTTYVFNKSGKLLAKVKSGVSDIDLSSDGQYIAIASRRC